VDVGDWGRITAGETGWAFWRRKQGTFVKEGNIYTDGIADRHGIPKPIDFGEDAAGGLTWVVSQNAEEMDISGNVSSLTPALATCSVKAGFHFSSGYGAILAMNNDSISVIEPAGCLRRLFDEPMLRDAVIVSQVHRCSSYARYLTSPNTKNLVMGMSAQMPAPGVASAEVDISWVRSTYTGNFKSKANKAGQRNFCPLFRLVSLKEGDTAVGLRGSLDDGILPLADAQPPWILEDQDDAVVENVP